MTDSVTTWNDGSQAFVVNNGRIIAICSTGTVEQNIADAEKIASLHTENARLRAALLPFAQMWAAYQRDYNSDINTSPLYEFIGEELNWFKMWMQHDGYKVAQEADYQQAAQLVDVEASSTSEGDK